MPAAHSRGQCSSKSTALCQSRSPRVKALYCHWCSKCCTALQCLEMTPMLVSAMLLLLLFAHCDSKLTLSACLVPVFKVCVLCVCDCFVSVCAFNFLPYCRAAACHNQHSPSDWPLPAGVTNCFMQSSSFCRKPPVCHPPPACTSRACCRICPCRALVPDVNGPLAAATAAAEAVSTLATFQ